MLGTPTNHSRELSSSVYCTRNTRQSITRWDIALPTQTARICDDLMDLLCVSTQTPILANLPVLRFVVLPSRIASTRPNESDKDADFVRSVPCDFA